MSLGQYCMAEQLSHPLSGHGHRADPQVEVELGRDKKHFSLFQALGITGEKC